MVKNKNTRFEISEETELKLKKLKQVDKRSMQKEIEWLIDRRYEEVKDL